MKAKYLSLVMAVVVVGAMCPDRAVARKMYWAERSGDRIGRANLDGTNPEYDLIVGRSGPTGIDVHEVQGKIYWTEVRHSPGIYRANLDGSNVEAIITENMHNPGGIALDPIEGKMYWAHDFLGVIEWADIDGNNREQCVTGLADPYGVALDPLTGKVYWTDSAAGKVQRAPCGGPIEDVYIGLNTPQGIDVNPSTGDIYWADPDDGTIYLNNADLITGLAEPMDIDLDLHTGKIYWTHRGDGTINRANLDGTHIEEDLITGLDNPQGIAVAEMLSGDLNGDGFVGHTDLGIVLDWWGQTVTPGVQADPTGDGFVGQSDLDLVLGHWGEGILSPLAPVPEPTTLLLLGLGGMLVIRRHRN